MPAEPDAMEKLPQVLRMSPVRMGSWAVEENCVREFVSHLPKSYEYITNDKAIMKLKGVSQVREIYHATQCGKIINDEIKDVIRKTPKRIMKFLQKRFVVQSKSYFGVTYMDHLQKRFQISRSKRLWRQHTGYVLGKKQLVRRVNPEVLLSKTSEPVPPDEVVGYVQEEGDEEAHGQTDDDDELSIKKEIHFSPLFRTFPYGFKPDQEDEQEAKRAEYMDWLLTLKFRCGEQGIPFG